MDDIREQLRRYLEQRRELGERELVLDDLTVEEVLRIIGATSRAAAPESRARPVEIAVEPGVSAPRAHSEAPPDLTDWRAALRAAGAEPGATEPRPSAARERPRGVQPPPESSPPEERAPVHVPSEPENAADEPAPVARGSFVEIAPAGLVVGTASRELFGGVGPSLDTLDEIASAVASCTRCPLYATATKPVPGEGNPEAQLVVVGEAPGANEDLSGRPFVGQAGQLLTKILEAIELKREDAFICNVLKHRPPGNRNPRPEEVAACSPYLVRQIELIRPRVILALGTFAAQTLLDTKLSIGKLRGQIHRYYGVPLIVTYHPAALLRNPAWKRPTWEDVKLARRVLDRAVSGA